MYQRILLAVDGSHASELALHQAILVGQASGAEVEALSCLTRSRYALLNWLMRRVPHAMEPEIPHLHHIFHAAEGE